MGLFRRFVREAFPKIAVENSSRNLEQKMGAPASTIASAAILTMRRATSEFTANSANAVAMRRPDR